MIEDIKNELKNAYDYIVVPASVINVEVELPKMEKEDGGYYSLQELSDELGDFFSYSEFVDDRFVKFRWAIPRNGEEELIIGYLKEQGLVDMRDNGIDDDLNYRVDEIDFTALNGDEFGIFSLFEIKEISKIVGETSDT